MKSFTIRIVIAASRIDGVDAPTPEDLLGQVKDFVDVLRGVEKAIAPTGETELDWRITRATSNSPITFEVTPYSSTFATNIDRRAIEVERAASNGLIELGRGNLAPDFFTPAVLPRAHSLHSRVTNGLASTEIHFPDFINAAPISIDRSAADRLLLSQEILATDVPVPYREIGAIEGYISKIERDGNGKPILHVRRRLDGVVVKATGKGAAFQQLNYIPLGEIWNGLRVRLFGLLTFEHEDKIKSFHVDHLEILDQRGLPTMDDIVDPTFTEGLSTEEFLESIRRA
ncbi:MAG: hypothetical protein IPK75_00575 [Acidobacteria bacterium]|nr:hypothetical protein [Acidobacteriota bacterium]